MKKFIMGFIILCLALTLPVSNIYATGYEVNRIDSYVGKVVADLDNYWYESNSNGSYNPYQKRYYKMGKECVGYVLARAEEKIKLNGLDGSFFSGHGKDFPDTFPNGKIVTHNMTKISYTINSYKNDKGENLKANSYASFNSKKYPQYGHVIFVEEVISKNGIKYVYYTEGGEGFNPGELKKKTLSDFLNLDNGYVGCVTFTPANIQATSCTHTYDSFGLCTKCKAEYPISITSIVPTTYYTIKDDVPVRDRPYSPDTILKSLSKGTVVTVVGSGKNSVGNLWYKLSDENWIYSNNLSKTNPIPTCTRHSYNSSGYCEKCNVEYPIKIKTITPTTYYAIKDDVPVRGRPYSPDTILNSLSKGTVVIVVGSGQNSIGNLWYKLSDENWIFSDNLTKTNPISGDSISITAYNANMIVNVGTESTLRFCSTVSTTSTSLGSLPNGTTVYVHGITTQKFEDRTWAKISYNGQVGWVNYAWLSESVPVPTEPTISEYNKNMIVNVGAGSTLRFCSTVSTTSTSLGSLPNGATVYVHGITTQKFEDRTWAKISYNGQVGWVNHAWLSESVPVPTEPTISEYNKNMIVNVGAGSTLRFCSTVSTTSTSLGSLPNGATIYVHGITTQKFEDRTWAKISYNGQVGWVNHAWLK